MDSSTAQWALLRALRPLVQALPEKTRAGGLASRLLRPTLLRNAPSDEALARVNGAHYGLRLNDYVEAKAWLTGREDQDVAAFCARHITPGGVAVDVGANVGFMTIPLAKRAQALGARVIAVEALPENARRLARHVTGNLVDATVSVVSVAAGARPGAADITVDRTSGFTTNGVIGATSGDAHEISTTVEVRTLDEICRTHEVEKIDVLKIDVEGFEPFVLQGGVELFARGAVAHGVLEVNEPHLAAHGWTRAQLLQQLHDLGLEARSLADGISPSVDFNVAFSARERD